MYSVAYEKFPMNVISEYPNKFLCKNLKDNEINKNVAIWET